MNQELETARDALIELIEDIHDALDPMLFDLCQRYVTLYQDAFDEA